MKLDRSTYEAWLLDRLEGRLDPVQLQELEAFLAANPDLQADVEELPGIVPPAVTFKDRGILRRQVPPTGMPSIATIDEFVIARMEGDLDPEQEKALAALLSGSDNARRQARLVEATRVAGDGSVMADKDLLRRMLPPQGMPDGRRAADFLIAAMEGDLSPDQAERLDSMLASSPALRNEQRLYGHARITATPVEFADKASLRRGGGRVLPLWWRVSVRFAAAASVVALLGLAWWALRPTENAGVLVEHTAPAIRETQHTAPEGTDPERSARHVAEPAGSEEDRRQTMPTGPAPGQVPSPRRSALASKDLPGAEHEAPSPVEVVPTVQGAEEHEHLAEVEAVGPERTAPPAPGTERTATRSPRVTHTVPGLLASTVRERVLDAPDREDAPLDGRDAIAAVDRGLAALSGGEAGLKVEETKERRRFDLRLGRGLSITASRGR